MGDRSSVKSILSALNVKLFIYFRLLEITNTIGSALKEAFWEEKPLRKVFLQPGSPETSGILAAQHLILLLVIESVISLGNHLFLLLQVACNSGVADMDSIPSVYQCHFRDGT